MTHIDEKELRQLLFWSHIGMGKSFGGSYQKSIPKIFVKYMKILKLTPRDFSLFRKPFPNNTLAHDVFIEWERQRTKRRKSQ